MLKVAVGSDERTGLTDFVVRRLEEKGMRVVLFGPLAGSRTQWADVAEAVASEVSSGRCGQGIVFCHTGTGVSIAANKIPGVRAALCGDAQTAAGARKWNDANVLAMSLRSTSNSVAGEMLESWFASEPDESERQNIEKIAALEKKFSQRRENQKP